MPRQGGPAVCQTCSESGVRAGIMSAATVHGEQDRIGRIQ